MENSHLADWMHCSDVSEWCSIEEMFKGKLQLLRLDSASIGWEGFLNEKYDMHICCRRCNGCGWYFTCLNQHQYLAAASITQSIANQLVTSTGISYNLNGSLPHMPWAASPNPQATSNFLSKDLSSSPAACCLKEDASYASTKKIRLSALPMWHQNSKEYYVKCCTV